MKTAGIIAEYNPFHNGHQYHIEQTREKTGADYIVAVMSGDFVQRGAPALIDKYERARCALLGGCDLVLELPVIYSTGSADFFASGAVTLLSRLGVIDYLSFGTESGTLDGYDRIAEILSTEPPEYQTMLHAALKSGLSYPAARTEALRKCFTSQEDDSLLSVLGSIDQPNNILALEYMRSLKNSGSSIKPFTIRRIKAGYHNLQIHDKIASASAIRFWLSSRKDCISELSSCLSQEMLSCLEKTAPAFLDLDHLTPYLHSILLGHPDFSSFLDWDQSLANRMNSLSWQTLSYKQIAMSLKSRHLTQTRIQRTLLHLLLNIKKEEFFSQYHRNPVPYAKILGFRKASSPLLKALKESSSIPIITKPASVKTVIAPQDAWVWEKDLTASDFYRSLQYTEFGKKLPHAYERSPIIL